ncbi:CoA-binding protein [Roseococcus sp. SDR]|uniref:CoA-binding protein n=1 Tax=Roseococcus sp. SDR TaxID=2835532 RepID=UPI001BD06BD9|nr:CoA-binding protein [Roseococcus sp. SDR]MBS7790156.1 CoA-binding protein [Roseococcus sp. SDR]MBV1845470.1 CoA-binding protein [Roseococcus sp. SDR]
MRAMDIRELLLTTRRIALVGASPKPDRASFRVMRFLLDRGYAVTPINPGLAGQEIHGQRVVARLAEAGPLDLVDVFRRGEEAGAVMDEAVALGARAVWLQLGVVDEAAAARARAKGVTVVMDRCPVIEWGPAGLPARISSA